MAKMATGTTKTAKPRKLRAWTKEDVRMLKALARDKQKTAAIARKLKRTERATYQKAVALGVTLAGGRGRKRASCGRMSTDSEIKAWQDRLIATFGRNGSVRVRVLSDVRATERVTGRAFVDKFLGHRVLTDSFLDFFGETIRLQSQFNNKKGWPKDQPYYVTALMMYLTVFRTIRAAELLSEHGYVLRGYAVQRSIKDQLWIICAAANEMATFGELFGWEGKVDDFTAEDQADIFKAQLNMENTVRKKIIGIESGLSEASQAQLLIWERLFNKEVHRAQFSLFRASSHLLKNPDIQLGPPKDELSNSMYLNRSMELNWIALRLIPFMRRTDTPASDEWSNKWRVLEESFRFMFDGFSALGKAIAPAFLELIESKCKFDTSTYFKEPKAKGAS